MWDADFTTIFNELSITFIHVENERKNRMAYPITNSRHKISTEIL